MEYHHLSINTIFSYFSYRTHRSKINECFSERSKIEHGVSQGSILGPLLFRFDLIHLFYKCEESKYASYYADDTTRYFGARDTLTNFFTGFSIIILKPILENEIHFWVPEPRFMYLLMMPRLKLTQKKPFLESWLTQNSVLTDMFLPFVVKLARIFML